MDGASDQGPEPSALEQGLASPAPAASFVSFVLPAAFEAERAKVEAFFAALPETVVRAKGFMRLDGALHLVQFAAGRMEVEPATGSRSASVVFICRAEPDRTAIEQAFRETRA
jgi:G3E family GTPase